MRLYENENEIRPRRARSRVPIKCPRYFLMDSTEEWMRVYVMIGNSVGDINLRYHRIPMLVRYSRSALS